MSDMDVLVAGTLCRTDFQVRPSLCRDANIEASPTLLTSHPPRKSVFTPGDQFDKLRPPLVPSGGTTFFAGIAGTGVI
jgi:hypothetical protein